MEDTLEPLDRLFDFSAKFAREMLEENGDFYPFGATITDEGEIIGVSGDVGGNENPEPEQVYDIVALNLAQEGRGGGVAAAALIVDVAIPGELNAPTKNAIGIHIEAAGFARFIYVPYELIEGDESSLEVHDPLAVEVEAMFFPT